MTDEKSMALANEYIRSISKQEQKDLERQVPICPTCGQPMNTKNDAEKYPQKKFKRFSKV